MLTGRSDPFAGERNYRKATNLRGEKMVNSNESTEKAPVLSDWVGYWVFISYLSGPNLDIEEPAKVVKDQPQAVTASFLLENYGQLGIEVKRNLTDPTIFMSWGSVLHVQGPPPDVRKQIDEEVAKQAQGGNGK